MRSPSPRVLSNPVTLYRFAPVYDADAGIDGTAAQYGAPFATNVPASVQLQGSDDVFDGDRPTRVNHYLVYFAADFALGLKDRIDWTDSGITHTLYVTGAVDAAGKRSTWEVSAIEKR
jgi:hypothetical protein